MYPLQAEYYSSSIIVPQPDTQGLNEEIRRRERVIRIFPNDDSAFRLIGALLAEQNENWQTRRYLDMDEFHDWLAEKTSEQINVVAINGKA